jgi:secreted trypsin-like serine protease
MYTFPEVWNPETPVNDVAVILLESPIPTDKMPADIVNPKLQFTSETQFVLAGYGRTGQGAENDIPMLRSTQAPFGKPLANQSDFFIGEGNFEKPATVQDPHGACQGDSGGPAYIVTENKAQLAGVIARGPDAENGGCFSSVTIVTDLRAYGAWIQSTIQTLLKSP